jgi:hypothetical protein
MAGGLQPDPSSVDYLSQVAASIQKLDAFYGLLASVRWQAKPLVDSNAQSGTWENCLISGEAWYGTMPQAPGQPPMRSWRSKSLDGLFDAFDPQDTAANLIAPLGALAAVEDEIRAAGGAVTAFQRNLVATKLAAIGQWLAQKSALYKESFDQLKNCIGGVRAFQTQMEQDNRTYQFSVDRFYQMDPYSVAARQVYYLNKRVIEVAKTLEDPNEQIVLAWSSMQGLLDGVTQKVAKAATSDIGTTLQTLNIGASLKEWPTLCEMAQKYRPGAPPAVPPPPDGFG